MASAALRSPAIIGLLEGEGDGDADG
jgi:hypothetical protein